MQYVSEESSLALLTQRQVIYEFKRRQYTHK